MVFKKIGKIILKILFSIIIILFIMFGLFLMIYSFKNQTFFGMQYLSGCSTFMISLLTLTYVITTHRQFNIMKGQLEEMKRERELQHQPLPWFSKVKLIAEKPRLFFSPPENEYSIHSRYTLDFVLKNIGNFPAVSIDVSACIIITSEKKKIFLNAASIRIDTLEEKNSYPTENEKDDFLFATDHKNALINALLETDLQKLPYLTIRVLYKNIIGGCFSLQGVYLIYPKDKQQYQIFKDWLSKIASFNIQRKEDIETLRSIRNKNEEQWDTLFEDLKFNFGNSLGGSNIELYLWPIPGEFEIKNISSEEYNKARGNIGYGVHLPPGQIKCPAVPSSQ